TDLPDQPGRLARGGAGQLALLNDLDIGMAGPGQDVRDRAPDRPAADDRDLSVPDASAALLRRAHLPASRAGWANPTCRRLARFVLGSGRNRIRRHVMNKVHIGKLRPARARPT